MRLIVVIYMLATALTTASACCRRMLRATITATPPHAIDSAAVWGKKQMCPCKTWVQGFSIWQDDSVTKPRGLTKIEFICGTQPAHGRSFSRIGSGEARGKHVLQNTFTIQTKAGVRHDSYCAYPRAFISGVDVYFGGRELGAVELRPYCRMPMWSTSPEKHRGEPHPHDWNQDLHRTLWVFNAENPANEAKGWTRQLLYCGSDPGVRDINRAVCGLNTKYTEESGIIEVRIMCCSFPAWVLNEINAQRFEFGKE